MSSANDNANTVSGYDVSTDTDGPINKYYLANFFLTFQLSGIIILLYVLYIVYCQVVEPTKIQIIQNKLSVASILLLLIWLITYIITNFLVLARVLSMNKGIVKSNLVQNSCEGRPMEGETVRYKMMYEMQKSGKDSRTIIISVLIGLLLLIWVALLFINNISPLYKYRALIGFAGALLLSATIAFCFRIGNYAKEPYGWYESAKNYKEKFDTLKKFAGFLQNKYIKKQDIPHAWTKLRYILIKRIAKHNNLANMKDAFNKFEKASPTHIAEFFRLSKEDDDVGMILEPLLCKNVYLYYYPEMLYAFLASKTVFPYALGSKNKDEIAKQIKNALANEIKNEFEIIKDGTTSSYVGHKGSRMQKALQAAKEVSDNAPQNSLVKMRDDISSTDFILYNSKLSLDDVYEFIPWEGEVNKEDVRRKFQRVLDTTTVGYNDPNEELCIKLKTEDIYGNTNPFFTISNSENDWALFFKLPSAVTTLKEISYGDPSAYTRESNRITTIYFFSIFSICFFALFRRIYNSGSRIMMILSIIIIFICIVLSSTMFIFA